MNQSNETQARPSRSVFATGRGDAPRRCRRKHLRIPARQSLTHRDVSADPTGGAGGTGLRRTLGGQPIAAAAPPPRRLSGYERLGR